MAQIFVVGKVFPDEIPLDMPEGSHYTYQQDGHMVLILLRQPNSQEIQAVSEGALKVGALVVEGVTFLLLGFGKLDYDCPFSIHLERPAQRFLPPIPEPGEPNRAWLQVYLVDQDSHILRAFRAATLPPDVTATLHRAINEEAETEWKGSTEYQQRMQRAYCRYPTPEAMMRAAVRGDAGA